MSKRCCAKNCFNSLLSNKKVEYFGIPRHEGFARAWCVAASREDLLEKPLNNIIKYHLCSDHFTDDCFKDPTERKLLKKTSRPVNVPLPTIFKNNIDQFLHKNNGDKYSSSNSILNNGDTLSQLSSTGGELESVDSIQILDDDCMYLSKAQEYDIDGMEAYCLPTNAEGPIQIYRNNDVEFMMEERLEEDEQSDDIYDEFKEDVKDDICDAATKEECENICRLCAEMVPNGDDMVDLFMTSTMLSSLDFVNKLLPKQIHRDDGLPQRICVPCLGKLEVFSHTLALFTAAQEKFQE
ncbi:hypothetical protein Bhyg_09918 [Pseudolycoriella hygida]|uniref:THAP-type domain-containing protein n=1 Tax=Pseudolycoriella hygida TaxID=35572 RepID=A0A9Q0MU90_9DIPT|nr:hypothetical protein Bhyg_09918 [Pseudolycoriella hygida]